MQLIIGKDFDEFSTLGARHIARYIKENPGRLLCLAAGDTPLGIFRALVGMQSRGEVDLNDARYVGLDEWVGIGYDTKGSCAQVMEDRFYGPAGIRAENRRVFDGLCADMEAECAGIDGWIEAHGGIGLAVLGIGMNGHIGFNEPGADPAGTVLTIPLDGVTAEVGKKYFGGDAPPARGATVGLARLRAAGEVALIAAGEKKGPILRRTLIEAPSALVPSSLMQDHERLTVLLDGAAFRAI